MLEKLDRLVNNERRPVPGSYSPDHVREVLARLGDPHRGLTAIHVAGTNGKGSVAHMIHAIFTAAGYTAGLYTSPHLLEVNERISIGGRRIPESELERYADEVIESAGPGHGIMATWFDVLTVIAFRYFRDARVDIAVIETGLGGRLDSTNVISPLCSVITDIAMDHADILGPTLEAIAAEKAGIIKQGTPVVSSNAYPPVARVISEQATRAGAPLFVLGRDFRTENVTGLDTGFRYDYAPVSAPCPPVTGIEVPLPLPRQVDNSALAVTAALSASGAFPGVNEAAVREGLARLNVPGRFELLSRDPAVIFDPAHNVSAVSAMVELVGKRHPSRETTLVLTLMRDKDIDGILSVISGARWRAVIYYALDDPRCYVPPPGTRADLFSAVIQNDEAALARLLDGMATGDSLFFFTGSFRLYRTALHYAAGARGRLRRA